MDMRGADHFAPLTSNIAVSVRSARLLFPSDTNKTSILLQCPRSLVFNILAALLMCYEGTTLTRLSSNADLQRTDRTAMETCLRQSKFPIVTDEGHFNRIGLRNV